MTMLTRSDILVGLDETDEGVPSRFKICSLLYVTAVEPLESKPAGPPDGDTDHDGTP